MRSGRGREAARRGGGGRQWAGSADAGGGAAASGSPRARRGAASRRRGAAAAGADVAVFGHFVDGSTADLRRPLFVRAGRVHSGAAAALCTGPFGPIARSHRLGRASSGPLGLPAVGSFGRPPPDRGACTLLVASPYAG